MMRHVAPCLFLSAVSLWVCAQQDCKAQEGDGIVLVVLKARVKAGGDLVRVGDVAEVQGGTEDLRQKIRHLDLAEVRDQEIQISREQIGFRLTLGGLNTAHVRLTGAGKAVVVRDVAVLTADNLVAAAQAALTQRLPAEAGNPDLRLVRPPQVPALTLAGNAQLRLNAEVAGPNISGRVKVDVSVVVNGKVRSQVPVFFDVAFTQDVAVTRRRIKAGESLSEENLQKRTQEMRAGEKLVAWSAALGGKARMALPPGQAITEPDVDQTDQEQPLLVKARDTVRLVAEVAGCRVTALGEALQDGKMGQVVRVRNLDSGKAVSGRVAERRLVLVEY